MENKSAYWVICESDPNDYENSQTPLKTELKVAEEWFNFTPIEREYGFMMRNMALNFLEDKEEEKTELSRRKLNMAVYIVTSLYPPGSDESDRIARKLQLQWLARLSGREGNEVSEFVGEMRQRNEAARKVMEAHKKINKAPMAPFDVIMDFRDQCT